MPVKYNRTEARAEFVADQAMHEANGIFFTGANSYLPEEMRRNFDLAMDAMPSLGTDPNAGFLALLSTYVDPEVYEYLYAPNEIVNIMGETKKGDWLSDTAAFPMVQQTGETSTYGDWSTSGFARINANWPQFQAFNYQVIMEWGEREAARYGLAKLNYVAEVERSATTSMNKYYNYVGFFGVNGLQNYGLLNNPYLAASLTPSIKANGGGTAWFDGDIVVATANEIFADVQATFIALVRQTQGLVNRKTKMKLALSPQSEGAFTTTNAFDVNVTDLLEKNFPNLEVVSAMQYQQKDESNPQGVAGGNFMQLIAESIESQKTGFVGFNEKMRTGRIVPDLSSFRQKAMAGSWGTILRMPVCVSSMLGI